MFEYFEGFNLYIRVIIMWKLEKLKEKVRDWKKIVKICWIREQLPDYIWIDMIGLNFVPISKRKISLEDAKKIETSACLVGLFQNQDFETIQNYVEILNLDMVQLHWDESNEFCQEVKSLGVWVIKAIKAAESQKSQDYKVDYIIFDNVKWWSGLTYDYDILENVQIPYLVAWWVSLDNIQTIFSKLPNAIGVDIASGAETHWILDMNKIRVIVEKVNSKTKDWTTESSVEI